MHSTTTESVLVAQAWDDTAAWDAVDAPRPTGLRRWARWVRKPWLIGPIGLVMAASWMSAYASWTDSVQASTSASAGSVDITAAGQNVLTTLTNLDLASVLPGATSYASMVISNTGTAAVHYSMTTASSGSSLVDTALASALQLGVAVIPAGATCDATSFAAGTTLQALTANLNNAAFSNRALASGASETLCFNQVLPLTAAATLMSKTTNTVFTFTAS